MRSLGRYFGLLAALVLSLAAHAATAQTTGTIQGVVKDAGGAGLPGVTVEVRGPALQGEKTAVTGIDGTYRISLLPPGNYAVTFSLAGFGKVQKNATVSLDKSVVVETTMMLSTREDLVVTGEAPVVDATSSTTGTNWTSDFVKTLPTGRNFTAVATKSPGVIQGFGADQQNINVQGSTGAENNFIIDGVDTTEVQYGRQGKAAPNEFIQELEVKSGGYQAEYGHALGGVINAVTKQGGNSFHGDAFGYYTGRADDATGSNFWQSSDKNVQAKADSFGTNASQTDPIRNTLRSDYGADLGGFVIKDRIWFFGAYDKVHLGGNNFLNDPTGNCPDACDAGPGTGTLTGQTTATITNQELYAGKLTFQVADGVSLVGSVFGDPNSTGPNLITPLAGAGPGTYQGDLQQGGVDYSGRISGVFGSNFLVEAQAARHNEQTNQTPLDTDDRLFRTITPSGVPRQGGFGFHRQQDFHRDFFRAGVTNFGSLLGTHEIKLGGDYANAVSDSKRVYTGPSGMKETVFIYNTPAGPVYQHEYNSNGERNSTGDPVSVDLAPGGTTSNSLNYGAYLQDRWQILPNLTLNLGVRWEGQQVKGTDGSPNAGTQISINDEWMPRVGFAWDFLGGGRSRLYGSYARFYETMPTDINIRAYGLEITTAVYNFDPNSDVGDPAACLEPYNICTPGTNPANKFGASSIKTGGSFGEPTQPGIKGQYSDGITGGVQIQALSDLSFGVEYNYRSLGRVIEDGGVINSSGDLEYFIFNPGTTFTSPVSGEVVGSNYVPYKPKRFYRAVQVTAQKRFSNNLQFLASYVYAKLEGNYDGVFQTSTGQLDPNINSAYDYVDFMVNSRGYLSNDRRNVAKLDGSYVFPMFPLTVGLSTYYYTGTPLNRMGYYNDYRNYELFLVPRGTAGRTPDVYDMDLHFAYVFKLGPVDLNAGLNVFNVLDQQRVLAQDQRYDLEQGGAQQPNYLQPISFTPRRSLQVFGRVSF